MTTNEEPAERLRVSAARLHVVLAAVEWWQEKRPAGWDVHRHLAMPTMNCDTDAQVQLAKAVASDIALEVRKHE